VLDKTFAFLKGRTTAFCLAFFVVGNILQFLHRLDMTYITFMGTLLGAVIGHSYKEDKHEQAMKEGGDDAK
jgi:undecaprenyl pyrophosphate phosphatase UppP